MWKIYRNGIGFITKQLCITLKNHKKSCPSGERKLKMSEEAARHNLMNFYFPFWFPFKLYMQPSYGVDNIFGDILVQENWL